MNDDIDEAFGDFFRSFESFAKEIVASRIAKDATTRLTESDKDMFERALRGYARTELELCKVRELLRAKAEIPDEYIEKQRPTSKYSRLRKKHIKYHTHEVVSSFDDIFRDAFDALRSADSDGA